MIEFFLPMIPPTATAQEKQIGVSKSGKRYLYDPANVRQARQKFLSALQPYKPATPYTVPVRLITKWLYPITGNHKDGEYKGTKPDTDNIQKLFKDCMTKTKFWKDDALVASDFVEKFYAERTGIYVRIEVLP